MPIKSKKITAEELFTQGVGFSTQTTQPEFMRAGVDTSPSSSFLDVVSGTLRNENTLTGLYHSRKNLFEKDILPIAKGEFDPFDFVPEQYSDYASKYALASNQEQVDEITSNLDSQLKFDETIAKSNGFNLIAGSLLGGVLDPVNLIPVGGTAYKTYRTVSNVAQGTARTAGAGLASTAGAELILQSTDPTRTSEESYTNITAGTFLSGILGGTLAGLGTKTDSVNRIVQKVEKDLNTSEVSVEDLIKNDSERGLAVGAAPAPELSNEQLKLAKNLGVAKKVAFVNPILRTLTSDDKNTKLFAQKLVGTSGLRTVASEQGIPLEQSVSEAVILDNAFRVRVEEQVDDLFSKYRYGRSKRRGDIAKSNLFNTFDRENPMYSHSEFLNEVSFALRRNEVHDVPEVAQAAKLVRRDIFDRRLNELKEIITNSPKVGDELGITLEDLSKIKDNTSGSYLTRVYNHSAITANRAGFKGKLKEWLSSIEENADLLEDADYLDEVADQITDRILGNQAGKLDYDLKFSIDPKRLKSKKGKKDSIIRNRKLDIPDTMIEEFLENDLSVIIRKYENSISSDIQMAKKFGSLDMMDELQQIRSSYRTAMNKETNPKKIEKLRKRRDADLRDMMAMRDILRGKYNVPADPNSLFHRAANNIILPVNYMRALGGLLFTSASDVGKLIAIDGMSKLAGKTFTKMQTTVKNSKIINEDLTLMIGGLERYNNGRQQILAEMKDDFGRHSKIERAFQGATDTFSTMTGMNDWNDGMRFTAGWVAQSKMMNVVERAASGKLKRGDKGLLGKSSISMDDAKGILEQAKKYGEKTDSNGGWALSIQDWDDRRLADIVKTSVLRDVERAIITPRAGEKALWIDSGTTGRIIGQFRSFGFASISKTLIAGSQGLARGEINELSSMMAMTMLGSSIAILKSKLGGYELNRDAKTLIAEGIDRSGIFGIFMDANNIMEKMTRGRVGMSRLTGTPPMSRFASRSVLGAILGPSADMTSKIAQVVGSASTGDFKESDAKALRRLVPFNTIPYLKPGFDEAESKALQLFGTNPVGN